jgi:hypothetical protein
MKPVPVASAFIVLSLAGSASAESRVLDLGAPLDAAASRSISRKSAWWQIIGRSAWEAADASTLSVPSGEEAVCPSRA